MVKLGTLFQVGRSFGVRDGMLRLEYELQRGCGLMSQKMRSVKGWNAWDLQRIAPDASAEEMLAARRDGSVPFFFTEAPKLGPSIKHIIRPVEKLAILTQAERVLAGHVPFFGDLSFDCNFPHRWFQNPATGQSVSPRQPWTQMRFASPAYGDLKFILEPSRFLFVYPLVRAYALSSDERFPQAFWHALEDWARQSPPMAGPLWICGQECSLRILAWSFALHAFAHSPSTTAERIALLVSMIAAHAWRTVQTLGYARSQRSNHLISEAAGLWTVGTLYPELREADAWRNLGGDLLHDAVLDQITPHGVSQQHSFNYQRMILHLLLWTLRLSEIHNAPLHDCVRVRSEAAFDFMRTWVDPVSGMAPNYGSNDGALILPLACGEYRDYRPLLQLGAAILNRPALQQGPWDESLIWFGVKPAGRERAAAVPELSAHTGYFRLGDETSWALIRAGHYSRRPFQSDQLHVDLWWQGINLARDAGTYLYNGASPWNNGFAGTSIHNTVTVDHRDQMRRAGRFLWVDWAQASGRLCSLSNRLEADCFEGEHDGYRNLGVKHRRMVRWLCGFGWLIVDDIDGTADHDVRLHWLAADLPYEISGSLPQVVFAAQASRIRWSIFSSIPGNGTVIRAGKQSGNSFGNGTGFEIAGEDARQFGWESPTYGDLQPAVSLLYQTRSCLPVRFVTVVLTDERCDLKLRDDLLVLTSSGSLDKTQGESEVCRVRLSTRPTHLPELQSTVLGVPRA